MSNNYNTNLLIAKLALLKGAKGDKGDKGDPGSETAAWGHITGTLSEQTDLNNALNGKQATLINQANIKSVNGQSLLGSGNLDVNPSAIRSNISVSVIPTSSSYQSWDSQQQYGYSADITVNGITANSLIENIVMTDVLLEAIAPVIKTGANKLTVYSRDATALIGTIFTLVTKEVA